MISTPWTSCYKYDEEIFEIKHSPDAAVPVGILPFTSFSFVCSPSEEGVKEATSCIPGSRIFKKTLTHLISRLSSRLSLPHVYQTPSNKQNNERHLINGKIIRVEYPVRKGIRVTFDH